MSFELDPGERLFEALTRVKSGEKRCDQIAPYPGDVFNALCTGAQPEIAEVTEFHDVAVRQLIRNDGKQDLYRSDHVGRAQRGHIARPFGKLAHAHSARRLDGRIVLLRRFAMAWSASFDDIEFDGHGQFLSIACLQESKIDLRTRAIYRQVTASQFSVLKGGHTAGN